jgi:GT2 family glycosyltransferase
MSTKFNSKVEFSTKTYIETCLKVTVAIITYNGINVIPFCLKSIFEQTYSSFQVIVINNASTDGTAHWIQQHYPQVQVINLPNNNGPNPARNRAIKSTPEGGLTLLIDDDAILDENCLMLLIKAAQAHPDGVIWAPQLVYYNQPDIIQHSGTFIHYTGEAILVNSDLPVNQENRESFKVHAVSGTCLLLKRDAAMKIGLFDEDYFFGRTDGEFSFRLTLSGHPLYMIPAATCFHQVKPRGFAKLFYQIRNRWYFILSTYSLWTLIVLAPALIIYEFSLIAFLILKGKMGSYLEAMVAVIQNLPKIWHKRQFIQASKVVSDRHLLRGESLYMRKDLLKNNFLKTFKLLLDRFFGFYWKLVRPFIL